MTKHSSPVAYTAPHPVYVDQRYYKAGEQFVTSAKRGDAWEEVSPAPTRTGKAAEPKL